MRSISFAKAKSRAYALVLPASGWVEGSQTAALDGVTADNNVLVAPAPESREAFINAEIYCTSQTEGKLTFSCVWTPDTDVTVNAVLLP